MDDQDRITYDPQVMGGKPCIRGLRVTVSTVVGLVASGHRAEAIATAYPYLEAEDVRAALEYGAWKRRNNQSPPPDGETRRALMV